MHWYYNPQTKTREIDKISEQTPGIHKSNQFQSHIISRDEGSYVASARTEPANKVLGKRPPKEEFDQSETPQLTEKQLQQERVSFDKKKFEETSELYPRLKNFMKILQSRDPKHVQKCAQIMDKVLSHFSSSFGYSYNKTLEFLNAHPDFKDVFNMEQVRQKMVKGERA